MRQKRRTGLILTILLLLGAPLPIGARPSDWDGDQSTGPVLLEIVAPATGVSRGATVYESGNYLIWREENNQRIVIERRAGSKRSRRGWRQVVALLTPRVGEQPRSAATAPARSQSAAFPGLALRLQRVAADGKKSLVNISPRSLARQPAYRILTLTLFAHLK